MKRMKNIEINETGCWLWVGKRKESRGWYGIINVHKIPIYAHRVAWILFNGPIPARHEVMHTCDNPPCVNPAHLKLGTHFDNMKDMQTKGRSRGGAKWKTHCLRGHEFTPENTYWYDTAKYGRPIRACRLCIRIHSLNRRKTHQ